MLSLFIIFTVILFIVLLGINLYLPISNPDTIKLSPYELLPCSFKSGASVRELLNVAS